jgi:hypothetical protein
MTGVANSYHNSTTRPSADLPPDVARLLIATDPVLAHAADPLYKSSS